MFNAIHLATAGIGSLVVAYGLVTVSIVGLLAAAYFSPILKKDFVWAAVVLLISATIFTIGVNDEKKRCDARNQVAVQQAIDAGTAARDMAVEEVKREQAAEAQSVQPVAGPVVKLPFVHAPARVRRPVKSDPFNRDTKPGHL